MCSLSLHSLTQCPSSLRWKGEIFRRVIRSHQTVHSEILMIQLEIKVVCDVNMNAMYMSRAPIPSIDHEEKRNKWWKQVCIMPFRWHFMKKFNHDLIDIADKLNLPIWDLMPVVDQLCHSDLLQIENN